MTEKKVMPIDEVEKMMQRVLDEQNEKSLRDWFAGMALSNFEIRRYQYEKNYHLIAEACYKLANAMLKERENGGEEI